VSEDNGRSKTHDVAVIGCGLMGSALARTFADRGLRVAAWNRTPERAEALSGDGVTPVTDIDVAVRTSRLVVACTSTYETTMTALEAVSAWNGTALVNIGTSSPPEAEQAARWAAERGAAYLDGSILCYPQQIGTPEGFVVFSGTPDVWAEHERTLMVLGEACRHVADQVRGASVIDAAITGAFYVAALGAYVEAITYAQSEGVSAEALQMATQSALEALKYTTDEAAASIASDSHATDQATLEVYAQGSRTTLAAMRAAGHRARLLGAAVENLNAAEAAGLGKLGFYAQTKVTRTGAPA
jgi:3-hydroxyisobutyrate dehydrogenase-like beta-hydroxyacid dehydrogenase